MLRILWLPLAKRVECFICICHSKKTIKSAQGEKKNRIKAGQLGRFQRDQELNNNLVMLTLHCYFLFYFSINA